MPRKLTSARMRRTKWAPRLFLAVAAMVLGSVSLLNSLARAVERAAPWQAHQIDGGNAVVAASAASHMFFLAPTIEIDSEPIRLARAALLRDATAVDAVVVLATHAQLGSRPEVAKDFFEYAIRLSRRSFRSQIWAIEEAVNRGDIEGALYHYDLVLRTSHEGTHILLPNLVGAVREPAVRQALVAKLAENPSWSDAFLTRASSDIRNPSAVRTLYEEATERGVQVTDDMRARLVSAMVRNGNFADAWNFYRTFRASAGAASSRDPEFNQSYAIPTSFDWQLSDNPRVSSATYSGENASYFEFSAPPSVGGKVVEQTLLLPVGRYVLRAFTEGIDQPRRSLPFVQVNCRSGDVLSTLDLTASQDSVREESATFIVPESCPVQDFSVILRPSDEISGSSGRILTLGIASAS